jgi:hypothetical protein
MGGKVTTNPPIHVQAKSMETKDAIWWIGEHEQVSMKK